MNMRTTAIKTVVLTVVMTLLGVAAQAADFSFFGSYWSTDDADDALGAGLGVHFDTVPIELRGTVYPDVTDNGGDVLVAPIDFGVVFNLARADAFDFFVGGGGSYHIIDTDHGDPDNEFGWYALARIEIMINERIDIMIEPMYRGVEFDDVDADLSGPAVNAGIVLR